MKLAVFSILLLLQLSNEIMGYKLHSRRNLELSANGGSMFDLFSGLKDELGKEFGENDEQSREALELIVDIGEKWLNAYKERKLEPITSTLYKTIRTIIVKTNDPNVKKIFQSDDAILKMLDELNSEKDVAKLFEDIGKNGELFLQALEVFNAYTGVNRLVSEDAKDKIEKLLEDAVEDKGTEEFIQSVVEKFMELAMSLSDSEDVKISDLRKPILELSDYLIDSIANGKLQPILQAIYDAAQISADDVDMNDPAVRTFLNEVLKFEKILKTSIEKVSDTKQRRNFFVRQLLKLN